jgi:hypothetical protein
MNIFAQVLALFILLPATLAWTRSLSDSLPIEGHFSQSGNSASRFKVERFLLKQDSSVELADRSLGYKWSGHVIGASLWCVNLGVNAFEFEQFLDALKKQNSILDSSGKQAAFSNNLYKFTIPLTIGSDAASFVQSLLYDRSDYLLHKAALAYNTKVAKNGMIDLHIVKEKNGWYEQGGLFMSEPVLYGVLREQPASRARANWSASLKEIGIQAGEWGGMYIALALLSYLEEASGDSTIIVDKKARNSNLTIGVSLVSFAIVNAIVSAVTRNAAIKKYNAALPKPPSSLTTQNRAALAPDSTGIHEGPATAPAEAPAKAPVDTAATKKEEIGK